MNDEILELIVKSRNYDKMTHFGSHPMPGEYVITGPQAGGFKGWNNYVGYVVQVRKKAGAFGSDMILLRHPDGTLSRHENQSFHLVDDSWLEKLKGCFKEGVTPELYEDYTQPYTLGNGEYPETGAIIEPSDNHPEPDNSPLMQITTARADGSKVIEVC